MMTQSLAMVQGGSDVDHHGLCAVCGERVMSDGGVGWQGTVPGEVDE
jgi:hypothetical protein